VAARNHTTVRQSLTLVLLVTLLSACNTARVDELESEVEDLRQQLNEVTSTTTPAALSLPGNTVPKKAIITGVVMLPNDGFAPKGATKDGRCWGIGVYEDVSGGAGVLVRDGTEAVIAASFLEGGVRSSTGCDLGFLVEVPADLDTYTVEVKNVGGINYSAVELDALGWAVQLDLR
jgi:hypothetical protein